MDRTNFKSYILMFLLLVLLCSFLNTIYVYAMQLMPSIYMFLAVFLVFAYTLGETVKYLVKILKLPKDYYCFVFVICGLLIGTYIKWNCFFGYNFAKYELMLLGFEYDFIKDFKITAYMILRCVLQPKYFFEDIVMFNSVGTWGLINERGQFMEFVRGGYLAVIWITEFFVLTFYPLFTLNKSKE